MTVCAGDSARKPQWGWWVVVRENYNWVGRRWCKKTTVGSVGGDARIPQLGRWTTVRETTTGQADNGVIKPQRSGWVMV